MKTTMSSFKRGCLALLFMGFPMVIFAQYQINGNASSLSCNCYELTPNVQQQSGSVWNVNTISLAQAFDFTFDVFLGCSDGGADGMAFGLQPIGTGVGASGGGMGFGGVTPSVGIFIDTYYNGASFDPTADHLAINANGNINHDGGVDDLAGPASLPFNIEDCAWHVFRVTWDPATFTMEGYMDGVLYVSYSGDIVTNIFGGNPNVYWGMTAGTGSLTNQQQFCTELNTEWATALADYTCEGQPMEFSDSTASFGQVVNWNWNFGDGNSSTSQNPSHVYATDGMYNVTLTVTDASGCQDSVAHPVLVTSPTLNPTATPDSICPGGSTQLNAGLTHPFSSEYTYSWTPVSPLNDPTLSNPTATPAGTEMYYITAIDSATNCSVSDSILVTVIDPPSIDPIIDLAVCESYTFPAVQGTNLTSGVAYYTGQGGSGNTYSVGDNYASVGATTFYVFDDVSGCQDEDSFVLTVVPLPTVDLGPDRWICPNDQTTLDATAGGGASYNWIDGSANATLTVSSTGAYWVEVTENGCTNSDTAQVSVATPPIFSLGADTVVCEVPFEVEPSNVYVSYLWSDGTTNAFFTISEPGTYTVTVTDTLGCEGSSNINVGNGCEPELIVPNVFTPNGDNTNDLFVVNASNIEEFEMVILNRWGNVIRVFNTLTDEWDGTTENGDDVQEGVYFWKITYTYIDGDETVEEQLVGNVTLLRD